MNVKKKKNETAPHLQMKPVSGPEQGDPPSRGGGVEVLVPHAVDGVARRHHRKAAPGRPLLLLPGAPGLALPESPHDVVRVRGGADEEPARVEALCCVPQHAVGLRERLEAVVEGELAADHVEAGLRVSVPVAQARLGAVGGDELGGEQALVAVPEASWGGGRKGDKKGRFEVILADHRTCRSVRQQGENRAYQQTNLIH